MLCDAGALVVCGWEAVSLGLFLSRNSPVNGTPRLGDPLSAGGRLLFYCLIFRGVEKPEQPFFSTLFSRACIVIFRFARAPPSETAGLELLRVQAENGKPSSQMLCQAIHRGMRPVLPVGAPPGLQRVLDQGWAADPVARPGAQDLRDLLVFALGSVHSEDQPRATPLTQGR